MLLLVCMTIPIGKAGVCWAQSEGPLSIRVESREVVVPVFVVDKSDVRHTMSYVDRSEEIDKEITGLTAKDFRIFEDGVEQKVQSVMVEPLRRWAVRDNVSVHVDSSCTPRGIWSSPDLWPQTRYVMPATNEPTLHVYLISYLPPPSTEGSCHQIKVKVDRHPATVTARDGYCNIAAPPSDPVRGTAVGKQMEGFAESGQAGEIPMTVQAAAFLGEQGESRVDIAVGFPANELKREWHGVNLDARIAISGQVQGKNKSVVTEFSDNACYCSKFWAFYRGDAQPSAELLKEFETIMVPGNYQTQIDLPPGEYELKLVMTDGKKFGRAEAALKVDGIDRKGLGISDIALCKRFQKAGDGAEEAARTPEYVPLVKNDLELTLASSTRFGKGERMMTYVQIYPPGGEKAGPGKVLVQMKVTEVQSGAVKLDTGMKAVEAGKSAGKNGIAMVEEVGIEKLKPGEYRLEMQAGDGNGNKSEWREALFTIE